MFSRVREVMKNKNRVQKESKRKRLDEINEMRADSIFKAKLTSDLRLVALIIMDDEIESVEVEVGQENVARLDASMYKSEMAEYNVKKSGNRYEISGREVNF